MKKEDAIKYLQQLYPNGGHCWLDAQRIEAIDMAVKALQEEPVELKEEDLENYNKVQKIREEVERLKEETSIGLSEHENGVEQGRMEIIDALSLFLDSLQKEPVSKVWHYQKKEPVNEIADKSRPIIVVYGNNSLNAAGKFRCYEDNSDAIWLSNSYEKWAFVEDLISLSHSVTKVSWQEEPVSVWHNVQYPYDETKPVLIVAIDHTLHLWKGKFDTDKMCNAFRLFTGTDWNNKPSSIVTKWAYIDDLLKF